MRYYILYRLGEFISLYSPRSIVSLIARMLSFLQYFFSAQDRNSVRNNLKAVSPALDNRLLERHTRNVFMNFARYLAVFLRFKKLDLAFIKSNVRIEGRHYIDQALSLGRGLIIVSGHIGNWELGGVTLALLGYPVNAITLTHAHSRVNDFFDRQRTSKGLKVIPMESAVRATLQAINRNEIVCILGDRDFTQGGIVLNFLGLPAMIPKGPAVFSLRNKTPVIPSFALQEDRDRLRLIFQPPISFTPSGEYEQDVRALTGLYLRKIEECVRLYPDQWAMFRRFWL